MGGHARKNKNAPPIKWTLEMRTVLHLLQSFFNFDHETDVRLFCHLYAAEMTNARYNDERWEVLDYRLRDHYRSRNQKGRENAHWGLIFARPLSNEQVELQEHCKRLIRYAATALGIAIATVDGEEDDEQNHENTDGIEPEGGDMDGEAPVLDAHVEVTDDEGGPFDLTFRNYEEGTVEPQNATSAGPAVEERLRRRSEGYASNNQSRRLPHPSQDFLDYTDTIEEQLMNQTTRPTTQTAGGIGGTEQRNLRDLDGPTEPRSKGKGRAIDINQTQTTSASVQYTGAAVAQSTMPTRYPLLDDDGQAYPGEININAPVGVPPVSKTAPPRTAEPRSWYDSSYRSNVTLAPQALVRSSSTDEEGDRHGRLRIDDLYFPNPTNDPEKAAWNEGLDKTQEAWSRAWGLCGDAESVEGEEDREGFDWGFSFGERREH